MKIYVGNLPRNINEDTLKQAFEQYGKVDSIKIIKDKFTGEAKGFGFLEMPVATEAEEAINKMNGSELPGYAGQKLRVNEAREPEAGGYNKPRPTGRYGGGNGGGRGGNDRYGNGGSRGY
jgi:cold-inducible RNA-binding protein